MAEYQTNASRTMYATPAKSGGASGGAHDYSGKATRKDIDTNSGNGLGNSNGMSATGFAGNIVTPAGIIPVSSPTPQNGSVSSNFTGGSGAVATTMTSPLRSAEAFESYCSQVQVRLAEHATHRINFLQVAYDRLTRLLHTARAVEDIALYNELWQQRVAVRELLEALSHVSASGMMSFQGQNTVPSPTVPSPTVPSPTVPSPTVPSPTVASAPPATSSSPLSNPPLSNSSRSNGALSSPSPVTTGVPMSGGQVSHLPTVNTTQPSVSSIASVPSIPSVPSTPAVPLGTSGNQSRPSNGQGFPGQSGSGKPANVPVATIAPDLKAQVSPPTTDRPGAPIGVPSGLPSNAVGAASTPQPLASATSGSGTSHTNGYVRDTPVPSISTKVAEKPVEKVDPVAASDAVRAPRNPVRPLTEIEADAIRLREQLQDWNARFPLHVVEGPVPTLNVPNCLRLRAVACRMRRLEEEAGDTEVTEVTELGKDIEDLLDDAGDEEYTVALDYELDPLPTAYQWGELAERYEETARAQEAFEWWIAHRNVLSVADVQSLAEAVAAIQQRFNRLLFRIGARDPFQQQLFDDLRVWAKEAQCYLYSLRPKVPIAELIDKAQSIDEAWEQARTPLKVQDERQKTLDMVIKMVSAPSFGADIKEDASRLQAAVALCKEMKVPLTDRRLRDALLPWGAFLENDERFAELIREIHAEWERRKESGKMETVESAPPNAMEAPGAQLEKVRAVTEGKRAIILGGVAREETRRKLEETLGLVDLLWPAMSPADTLAKFDAPLEQADIVLLSTRYSRKAWTEVDSVCTRDGKIFFRLTTEYSVPDVVGNLYDQLAHK